ncbi:formimidoylglutamase [Legionella waltersii]|uniref:Formimidoylglutamase n=1 Tax=Legionella waltersii TaxID=66969 RepID=A0A0W1A0B2_9GAMM|nr:formimidoylglutamase [Legionella waltersii]KTD74781.1 formiminoglutamase [Legionella waltersii]SNV00432.1 formimidoylglutamase [Legionella waltersii]
MFNNLSNYQAATPSIWQGRQDTSPGERFFQNISFPQSKNELMSGDKKTVFIGFASDTGVIRNLGRPGAKLGPDQLKTCIAKLPCSSERSFVDIGNIVCEQDDLESAQQQFAQAIQFCQHHGHQTVGLGGGHEIAWAHYQGLCRQFPKVGIINLDAHFDIRPYQKGQLGHSGTPFSQIANYCQDNKLPFHYCCLGIQAFGNTSSLFNRAKELRVKYLLAEDIFTKSLAWQLAFLDEFMLNLDHIYLTICLDAFGEAFAPGVSAPQPLGLTPWHALPLLKYIIQSGKVISFDVAELSPPLDQEQKTARLAALIIAELLDTN